MSAISCIYKNLQSTKNKKKTENTQFSVNFQKLITHIF